MQKITHLSNNWESWIADNLARGCSAASLLDSMLRENFEAEFAANSIDQLCANRAPSAYVHEKPRMVSQGNVIQTADRNVRLTFRISEPVLALLDNVLSPEECDELIRLSSIKLRRSTIVDPGTGSEAVIDDRSSFGAFFQLNENDFITRLDRRIAQVMHWPIENGEGIQILHYKIGGEYKAHFDYFPPDGPGSGVHLARGGQRVSTLIMYLNDPEAGGETIFPQLGLSIVPKKGSAIYFEYCNSQGQVDPLTLHGGLPVSVGEKWIATKWMRQYRYA